MPSEAKLEAAGSEMKANPPSILATTRRKFGAKRALAQEGAIMFSKARRGEVKAWLPIGLFALCAGVLPIQAGAHPGRLDEKGCHKVWKDWQSQDGKRLYKSGTRHCHRVSDEVKLGEDQILVEEPTEKLERGRDRAKERK